MDRVPSKITVGGRPSFQYRSLSPGGDRACFTFRSSHVFHLYFFFLATVILIHCFFWLFTTSLCLSGCLPNITRNAIVNCSELVTYDIIKELILKHNLMSGMCKHFTFSHWNFRHLITALFSLTGLSALTLLTSISKCVFHRQRAVSLHSSLRCRFLHHHCSFTGGRGENTLHEFSARAVQWCVQLCRQYAG